MKDTEAAAVRLARGRLDSRRPRPPQFLFTIARIGLS
jgi:hypothetical protein